MRKFYLTLYCLFLLGVFTACSSPAKEKYRETKALMGTFVQVDVCYDQTTQSKLAATYADLWKRVGEIAWRMSVFEDPSDVTSINHSYQHPVKIGADTYQLIQESLDYWRITGGRFDITVGPLVELWRGVKDGSALPSEEEIRSLQKAVGPQNIRLLEGNRVETLNPQTHVDLGGIAKGYAVDEAARILRAHGFEDFFIDAGGDDYVGGMSCENRLWRVGIEHPRIPGKLIRVVGLTDAAVTTSGDYEQYKEIGGKRYSHIIDPSTGWPAQGPVSATVIAPTAAAADALSTALSVMPPEEGEKLIDQLGQGYASLTITESPQGDLEEHESRRFVRHRISR